MNIGENIRRIRKEKGLSMKSLGKMVNVSEQAIGNYERGDRTPNIEVLNKIANALNVDLNELLGYTNPNKLNSAIQDCFDGFKKKRPILVFPASPSYKKDYVNIDIKDYVRNGPHLEKEITAAEFEESLNKQVIQNEKDMQELYKDAPWELWKDNFVFYPLREFDLNFFTEEELEEIAKAIDITFNMKLIEIENRKKNK